MRIVFMGTPEFAVPSLQRLLAEDYPVAAVYTQPDRASGRGRNVAVTPVKRVAAEHSLPILQPESLRDTGAVTELAELQPDVIVVVAYGLILPQSVLDIPPYGSVNIHPSLLPRHRGASPVAAAILAGDDFTGVSLMLQDKGLDTGPVLSRAPVSISDADTTGTLTAKLALVAATALLETLPAWLRDEISPRPQNKAGASYFGEFSKEDGEIDWKTPAVDIWRKVRAFHPWPGCYTRWRGKQLKIIEAVPFTGGGADEPGKVVPVDRDGRGFGVSTGSGVLQVTSVQLEGRRVVTAGEFLRGQRQFIGAVLPSD